MKKRDVRPPTRKKGVVSSPPLSSVSLGTQEKRLLIALSKNKKFSINGYSNSKEIPKSSTRSRLKKLHRIGLIDYEQAPPKILEKGIIYLENTNQIKKQGDESLRLGGRQNYNSTHWHEFTLEISNRSKFRDIRLNFEECEWGWQNMNNWKYIVARFNDATIMIKPKKIQIWLYDIVRKDAEEVDAICLRRLLKYVTLLKKLGIETNGLFIEKGHWARIDSALANWLYEKFEDRYELLLDDGTKFYIDFSANKDGIRKLEEETNKKIARQRVNKAMDGIISERYNLDNININTESIEEIRKALYNIKRIEEVRIIDKIEKNKLKRAKYECRIKELESNSSNVNLIRNYIN